MSETKTTEELAVGKKSVPETVANESDFPGHGDAYLFCPVYTIQMSPRKDIANAPQQTLKLPAQYEDLK